MDVWGDSLSPREFTAAVQRFIGEGKKAKLVEVTNEEFHSEELKKAVGEEVWLK